MRLASPISTQSEARMNADKSIYSIVNISTDTAAFILALKIAKLFSIGSDNVNAQVLAIGNSDVGSLASGFM